MHNKPSFIIASPFSGSGKTTLSLGIMACLVKKGYIVQPFKAGPDYIDPLFHKMVCGRPSYNLDTWMMGVEGVKRTFSKAINGGDIGIVEGVMGLFDGKEEGCCEGSTAHIAKVLNLPILLIIDASKMAQSVAPLVYGYETFDPDLNIAGVIFNKVGSERHYKMLKGAVEGRCSAKVLGFIPKEEAISIPERHLGLAIAGDKVVSGQWSVVSKLVGLIERFIDIDGISRLSSKFSSVLNTGQDLKSLPFATHHPQPTTKIAVAMDEAFSFYYEENFDILKEYGAELIPFSPLRDKALPKNIGGIYIGGGYPEVYADCLESNKTMREEIKGLAERGFPIYAECGGLMYLGRYLEGVDNKVCEMVGVFPWRSRMLPGRKALGYIEVKALEGLPFMKKGRRIRGHEFHYSEIGENLYPLLLPPSSRGGGKRRGEFKRVYRITDNSSSLPSSFSLEGYLYKNTLASYIHLHFSSNHDFARGFVEKAASFSLDNR